ncbi:hypothetical protein WG66_001554 [Moniliophthora roreri]|nr:hypothetical protein WG66_001554 [Moniliophthora roreri]
MSESKRISSGILSFMPKTEGCLERWPLGAYKAIEKIHLFKDLDSKTTVLARSLGVPLLQVVQKNRFQDLEDSSMTSWNAIVVSMQMLIRMKI